MSLKSFQLFKTFVLINKDVFLNNTEILKQFFSFFKSSVYFFRAALVGPILVFQKNAVSLFLGVSELFLGCVLTSCLLFLVNKHFSSAPVAALASKANFIKHLPIVIDVAK
jgi:hypothetical protein